MPEKQFSKSNFFEARHTRCSGMYSLVQEFAPYKLALGWEKRWERSQWKENAILSYKVAATWLIIPTTFRQGFHSLARWSPTLQRGWLFHIFGKTRQEWATRKHNFIRNEERYLCGNKAFRTSNSSQVFSSELLDSIGQTMTVTKRVDCDQQLVCVGDDNASVGIMESFYGMGIPHAEGKMPISW